METKTLRDCIILNEEALEEALRVAVYQPEKELLQNGLDSCKYITPFFSGEYCLPGLDTPFDSEWGRTFMYIWMGFVQMEEAYNLVNGEVVFSPSSIDWNQKIRLVMEEREPNDVGDLINGMESSFWRSYNLVKDPTERRIFGDAVDSIKYLRNFYGGEYEMPRSLDLPISEEWAYTYFYWWNSYVNVERAVRLMMGDVWDDTRGLASEVIRLRQENELLNIELAKKRDRPQKVAAIKKAVKCQGSKIKAAAGNIKGKFKNLLNKEE